MTTLFNLSQIKDVQGQIDSVGAIEEGFIAYSEGKVIVPPIGEMIFSDPPGEVHIKYGFIKGDEYYVIKIASGFVDNVKLGISTSNGMMLLFSQKTGELAAILLDEGYLTNVRTAAAGAVVAKHLAPSKVHRIGIFGAGVQGRMQLEYLKPVVGCRDAIIWGINQEELDTYKANMEARGYTIETTLDPDQIADTCNLIVTATPSKKPLLKTEQIKPGTHITAMGSDTAEKNELEPGILQKADIIVADSISQCLERGEIFQAIKAGVLERGRIVELGSVIVNKELQRSSDDQITIADLTGVAVQDIQITKAFYEALTRQRESTSSL